MSFANPEAFFFFALVISLPVVFGLSERKRRWRLRLMVSSQKRALVMGSGFERRLVTLVLICLALACLILAAARPQWGTKLETLSHRGIDVLIAIDVSESMRARDVSPDRISKARQEVDKFLGLLRGDRVGLIAFAGSAFTYCPLTVDYAAIRMFLHGLEPGVISHAGTDLTAAIEEAIEIFQRSKSNAYRVLVLFTDGETHEENPEESVKRAVEESIQIFTVGIGNVSKTGERIPVVSQTGELSYKLDQTGNLVITRLDEATLIDVAQIGNGKYHRVSEAGTELVKIYRELEQQEEEEFSSRLHHQREDRFQVPLLAGVIFLCLAFSLGNRSFKRLRRTQGVS